MLQIKPKTFRQLIMRALLDIRPTDIFYGKNHDHADPGDEQDIRDCVALCTFKKYKQRILGLVSGFDHLFITYIGKEAKIFSVINQCSSHCGSYGLGMALLQSSVFIKSCNQIYFFQQDNARPHVTSDFFESFQLKYFSAITRPFLIRHVCEIMWGKVQNLQKLQHAVKSVRNASSSVLVFNTH